MLQTVRRLAVTQFVPVQVSALLQGRHTEQMRKALGADLSQQPFKIRWCQRYFHFSPGSFLVKLVVHKPCNVHFNANFCKISIKLAVSLSA